MSHTIIVLIIPQNMTPCKILGLSSSLRIINPMRKKREPSARGNNLSDRLEASRSLTMLIFIKARTVIIGKQVLKKKDKRKIKSGFSNDKPVLYMINQKVNDDTTIGCKTYEIILPKFFSI